MSNLPEQPGKPRYRVAEATSAENAEAVFAGSDIHAIVQALIDGSRCLGEEWACKCGARFLNHVDAEVRWAALFAIDQGRGYLCDHVIRDKFEPVFAIVELAKNDPNDTVRRFAVDTLSDIIGCLRRG